MTATRVDDDELLYRAVRPNSDEYKVEDGRLRFTVTAFNNRDSKPSVDRSSMRQDPREARQRETDGVTSLVTRDVRSVATVTVDAPGGRVEYKVDAIHRPIHASDAEPRENLAHCQIECAPEIKRNHSKKLKEALAILATQRGWTVIPS